MTLWLCIVVRIVANPYSNVFQKVLTRKGAHPLLVIGLAYAFLAVVCLPLLVLWPPPLAAGFWLNIAACTVLAVVGNVLLVQALAISDLSVLGPINAYKSVVSLIPAALLLDELPGLLGLAGMALIVAGSYFLVDKDAAHVRENAFVRFFKDRGVRFRLAALVLNATEAIFLKKALLASSPLTTFACWSVLGCGVSLVAMLLAIRGARLRQEVQLARANVPTFLMLATTTGLMQYCTLVVLTGFQVSYALALFQTSTILSVVLGRQVFGEPHFARRLLGSTVMMAGAVLIVVGQ